MVTIGSLPEVKVRHELVYAAIQRADILTDPNILKDETKQYNSVCQKIFQDDTLTENEKMEAIMIVAQDHDYFKVSSNKGEKRLCKDCNKMCLATLYCEHCVRIYLINDFPNWTSGNNKIDSTIQEHQMNSLRPDNIIEWIPHNKLQKIKKLAEGGFAEVYSAEWIDGRYLDWYPEGQRLIRTGLCKVALKKLKKIENATSNKWYDEVTLHLKLCNELERFVACYGLTKDPSDGNYMIVMRKMDADLRKYLRQKKRTWKEKLNIVNDTIKALCMIHINEKAIHRDLHSGNILYSEYNNHWYISDFGLCETAGSKKSICGDQDMWGNMPYVAPEILAKKEYTFASDIYSFGILMWEISSEQIPFPDYERDYYLMVEITKGLKPEIKTKIPSKYEKLMRQCWDTDPQKRPDAYKVSQEITEMRIDSYKDDNEFNKTLEQDNSSQVSSSSSDSKQNSNYLTSSTNTELIYSSIIPQITDEDEHDGCIDQPI